MRDTNEHTVLSQKSEILYIWESLNKVDLEKIDFSQFLEIYDKSTVEEYFSRQSNYKFVDLTHLTHDASQYLENNGLSVEYLKINKSGLLTKEISDLKLDSDPSLLIKERRNLKRIDAATAFQVLMVQEGFLYSICPFSGNVLRTNRSLFPPFFYYFSGVKVFYVLTGDAWSEKTALYVPDYELVISLVPLTSLMKERLVRNITRLKINSVLNWKGIKKYLLNKETPKKAVVMKINHFAHHLWNELSGIHKLWDSGLLSSIDTFLASTEPIARINDIFPEITSEKVSRVGINQFFNRSLKQNYFLICLGHCVIKEDLDERIYRASFSQASEDLKIKIEAAKATHPLLLWISLRLGSRTWVSQAEGISRTVNKLNEDFPDIGLVIDAFSIPNDKMSIAVVEAKPLIQRLEEVSNQLESLLVPKIKVYNTIGCSMHESILWAHASDLYLAHQGSLQHKVGWIANKPGVIHTNTKVLRAPLVSRPGCWERENGILPQYVPISYISDVEEEVFAHGRSSSGDQNSNYDCNWEGVYLLLKNLADSVYKKRNSSSKM